MIQTENLRKIQDELQSLSGGKTRLLPISKTHPIETIRQAYDLGLRLFGENKVQEIVPKQEALPADIEWHLVGHLQSNKVKYIAPFVHLIHSIDSLKLLQEIDKQALKANRIINCLLQLHIAQEETKFGFSETELWELLQNQDLQNLSHIRITGLMGMASNTEDQAQIRKEFRSLSQLFEQAKRISLPNVEMKELSMGMSSDYRIAIEEGSTLIRVGSMIFGHR
jgi:PLP dependent protein